MQYPYEYHESLSKERTAMKHGFVDGVVNTLIRDQLDLAWSLSSSALNSVPQLRHRYMPAAPPSIRSTSSDSQTAEKNVDAAIDTNQIKSAVDKNGISAVTDRKTLESAVDEDQLNSDADIENIQSEAEDETKEIDQDSDSDTTT